MIRIFLAEDHQLVRDGLRRILAEDGEFIVTGEAGRGHAILSGLQSVPWDVLLLDITLPELNGMEVMTHILQIYPERKVLILTQHDDPLLAQRFLKAGASGYLTKNKAAAVLLQAIHKVASGTGRFMTPEIAEFLMDRHLNKGGEQPLHAALTDREYQVMRRIVAGESLSGIAAGMNLALSTVSTYRHRILAKMNLNNNAELVRYAVERGLMADL
ncbi:MAG: response regulator transcription factor [Magnetococcales bacterium]|nr:response regulator transcription factor [Magnetococcales bacterium]